MPYCRARSLCFSSMCTAAHMGPRTPHSVNENSLTAPEPPLWVVLTSPLTPPVFVIALQACISLSSHIMPYHSRYHKINSRSDWFPVLSNMHWGFSHGSSRLDGVFPWILLFCPGRPEDTARALPMSSASTELASKCHQTWTSHAWHMSIS